MFAQWVQTVCNIKDFFLHFVNIVPHKEHATQCHCKVCNRPAGLLCGCHALPRLCMLKLQYFAVPAEVKNVFKASRKQSGET